MREIKFRAWRKAEKTMHEVWGVTPIAVCTNEGASMPPLYEPIERFAPVMQYTGLNDKKGTEIYEGDVVDIQHPCWSEKCLVEFSNGSFIFRGLNGLSKDVIVPGYTFMRETWEIVVLGNIYENPELLTK